MKQEELLDNLIQSIAQQNWNKCSDICFQMLYNIPPDSQIKLTIHMMRRYIPIFRNRWVEVEWCEQILDDVEQWVKKFGRHVPNAYETVNPADAAFLFCFDALLLAVHCKANKISLTSSCTCAVDSAINARRTNVWIVDDPEAVELWSTQSYFPGRTVVENEASVAVSKREWREVVEWLRKEEVSIYSSEDNDEEIEKALVYWKDCEKLLIMPTSTKGI